MALNIVSLDPKASAKSDVIEAATELLEMAKAGRLVDLSYAASDVDGSVHTHFTTTEDSHRRLSAVSRLLHRLHGQMDQDAKNG
jgi:hypothetical protein